MNNTLETVIQGGALGLLAVLVVGAIYLAAAVVPAIRGFFEQLTIRLASIDTRAAVVEAKADAIAVAVARLEDALSAEVVELRQELGRAERRITAAVHREQPSDPPPPASRATASSAGPHRRVSGHP